MALCAAFLSNTAQLPRLQAIQPGAGEQQFKEQLQMSGSMPTEGNNIVNAGAVANVSLRSSFMTRPGTEPPAAALGTTTPLTATRRSGQLSDASGEDTVIYYFRDCYRACRIKASDSTNSGPR